MGVAIALGAVASWIIHDYFLPQEVTTTSTMSITTELVVGAGIAIAAVLAYKHFK